MGKPAARATDTISHTSAAQYGTPGGLLSLGVMLLIPPGPLVVPLLLMVAEEVSAPAGLVLTGSSNVIIGSLPAARAAADVISCNLHGGGVVAQGSSTVRINKMMAARVKDLTSCSAKISSGKVTVLIGGKTGTAVPISPEIPSWAMTVVNAMGLATMGCLAACGAFLAVAGSIIGAAVGEEGGRAIGGAIADATGGDREDYERIGGKIGGLVGGIAGGMEGGGVETGGESLPGETEPAGRAGGTEEPAPNASEDPSPNANEDPATNEPEPGESSDPENPSTCGDPVAAATGIVVDDALELTLPGLLPFEWKRFYSSARSDEVGSLGHGGWTHSFAQRIDEREKTYALRAQDGRTIFFEKVVPGASTFHRRERLTLSREGDGSFRVEDARTGYVRRFVSQGRGPALLTSIRDKYGTAIELAYDERRLASITDTAGRLVRLVYDAEGRLRRVEVWSAAPERARWQWVQYDYTATGELASATDALGAVTQYAYDERHRLVRRTLPDGLSFHYTYDATSGRCIRSVGDDGIYDTQLSFDDAARTTSVTGGPEPRMHTWDDNGLILREKTPDGSWVRAWEYDRDQYLTCETDPSGRATRSDHDLRGNLVARTDSAGNVTRWEIERDRPVRRRDPDGTVTTFTYDAGASLVAVTTAFGRRYRLTRDELGRIVGVDDDDGAVLRLAYDAHHNVVREIDARGAMTSYLYDPLGRPIGKRDAFGRETRVVYDAVGRVVRVVLPDGSTRTRAYDACGRLIARANGLNHVTRFVYRGLRALETLIEPTGHRWTFAHDTNERLVRITNPLRETYEYDAAGHITREKAFHGRTLRYAYRGDDLVGIAYPDGIARLFQYDGLGKVVLDELPKSSILYERDRFGLLRSARVVEPGAEVVTSFERDKFGRVVAEAHGDQVVRYAYDPRGRVASRILPNGATTAYQYDVSGGLVGVRHDGHEVLFERDVLGREVRRLLRTSGVQVRSAYDAMDRLTHQEALAPRPAGHEAAGLLSRRQWQYDAAGQVAGIDDARWGTTYYAYDAVGRLVGAARGTFREVFEYDAAGSLEGVLADLDRRGRERRWTMAAGNVLQESAGATYANDLHGRRTQKSDKATGGSTEYVWDDRDQLREVRLPDGRTARYIYDAFGRRVRKILAGAAATETTDFLWDRDVLALETRSSGVRAFVHGPGSFVPLLQQEAGQVFSYVNDHHGMPKELIDEAGRVAWSALHSAWGEVAEVWREPACARVETPFRMLGQYLDEETGLGYTRFRYFDPRVGRWLSPDPLGIKGGSNPLGWDGNPINDIDPLGLATTACQPNRPPNMSPPGAGRQGAFNEAKRQSGVPTSQQPESVGPNLDRRGNVQPGRQYTFRNAQGNPVSIRDDAGGHNFGPNDPQNRGPHFNDEAGNHYDY